MRWGLAIPTSGRWKKNCGFRSGEGERRKRKRRHRETNRVWGGVRKPRRNSIPKSEMGGGKKSNISEGG